MVARARARASRSQAKPYLRQAPEQHVWSGCPDSNRGPPAPKAGALTKLRHIPSGQPKPTLSGRARADATVVSRSGLVSRPVTPGARRWGAAEATSLTGKRYATAWRPGPLRGRSSMVELQPSKLVMRVRFPSPAPPQKPSSEPYPQLGFRTCAIDCVDSGHGTRSSGTGSYEEDGGRAVVGHSEAPASLMHRGPGPFGRPALRGPQPIRCRCSPRCP